MSAGSTNEGTPDASGSAQRTTVKTLGTLNSAELAAAYLSAQSIECWIESDDCGGMLPTPNATGGIRLVVRTVDLATAREALAAALVSEPLVAESSSSEPPRRRSLKSLVLLLIGVVMGILLGVAYQSVPKYQTKTFKYDRNSDGKPDEFHIYKNGVIVEWESDRNFDGKLDHWVHYKAGRRYASESDNNFDGNPDSFWNFEPATMECRADTDYNGTNDVVWKYKYDVLQEAEWRPNGQSWVSKRQLFRNGVLWQEFRDWSGDGKFDEIAIFDAFATPVATNAPALPAVPGSN